MIYGHNGIKRQWIRRYGASGIYFMFIAPMGKAWFYERFFIKVVIVKDKNVMVKDKINSA